MSTNNENNIEPPIYRWVEESKVLSKQSKLSEASHSNCGKEVNNDNNNGTEYTQLEIIVNGQTDVISVHDSVLLCSDNLMDYSDDAAEDNHKCIYQKIMSQVNSKKGDIGSMTFVARVEKMWEEPISSWSPTSTTNKKNKNNNNNKTTSFNTRSKVKKDSKDDKNTLPEYSNERKGRMKIRARWYFKKKDMQAIKKTYVGVNRRQFLNSLTSEHLVLGEQTDDNEVSTIFAKCNVIRRRPNKSLFVTTDTDAVEYTSDSPTNKPNKKLVKTEIVSDPTNKPEISLSTPSTSKTLTYVYNYTIQIPNRGEEGFGSIIIRPYDGPEDSLPPSIVQSSIDTTDIVSSQSKITAETITLPKSRKRNADTMIADTNQSSQQIQETNNENHVDDSSLENVEKKKEIIISNENSNNNDDDANRNSENDEEHTKKKKKLHNQKVDEKDKIETDNEKMNENQMEIDVMKVDQSKNKDDDTSKAVETNKDEDKNNEEVEKVKVEDQPMHDESNSISDAGNDNEDDIHKNENKNKIKTDNQKTNAKEGPDNSTNNATPTSSSENDEDEVSSSSQKDPPSVSNTPTYNENNNPKVTKEGAIHIGPNHQADIPPLQSLSSIKRKEGDNKTNKISNHTANAYNPISTSSATPCWSPGNISNEEVDKYLTDAATLLKKYMNENHIETDGGGVPASSILMLESFGAPKRSNLSNNNSSNSSSSQSTTPSSDDNKTNSSKTDDATPKQTERKPRSLTRECYEDKIIEILHNSSYDTKIALKRIGEEPLSYLTIWNRNEKESFNNGFRRYRGSLRSLSKGVVSKTYKDVIDYHYRFKIPYQFRKYQEKKREQARRIMGEMTKKDRDLDRETGKFITSNRKSRHWARAGASEQRKLEAKEYLLKVRDRMGAENYEKLADRLNSYQSKNQSVAVLKENILPLLQSEPMLLEGFLEFLPKKYRA